VHEWIQNMKKTNRKCKKLKPNEKENESNSRKMFRNSGSKKKILPMTPSHSHTESNTPDERWVHENTRHVS
jgi:hypothetical protein